MTKLEEIVSWKKMEIAQAKRERPREVLERQLKDRPPVRPLRQAIDRGGRLSLIAEVKRASPSAGLIRPGVDAVSVAKQYEKAGAQALSVLTDQKFFSGALEDLRSVKEAVNLPVLRKDFLLEEYQLLEAAAYSADCILLIAAILEGSLLKRLLGLARDLGLDALVEVHDERELGQALEAGAGLVGINNRNLSTLEVDLRTTQRLIPKVPPDRVVVSESGLHSRREVEFVQHLGARAVLIGEELMSAPDIGMRVKELMGW